MLKRTIFLFIILILAMAGTKAFNDVLFKEREKVRIDQEMAYFPNGTFLKEVVMGYDAVVADIAWLKAIQYYGKHRLGDRLFIWLDHIFNIVTDLDPNFINAYLFGALVISEDAREPEVAIKLLEKGIKHNPDAWRLYFEAGFIYYLILKEYDLAAAYFQLASEKPDAPDMCKRWAAFAARQGKDFHTSWQLWNQIYETAPDEYTKAIAEKAIMYLQIDQNIDRLTALVHAYHEEHGQYPSSIKDLPLTDPLVDPFGGSYLVNPQTGEVFSSVKQNEELDRLIGFVSHKANEFRKQYGYYPMNIDEMVEKGVLRQKPEPPYGTNYFYNSDTGNASPVYVRPQ